MKEKNIIKKLLNELKKNEINYPLAIVGSAVNNSKFNDLDFLMAVDDINIVKKKIKTAFNIYKVNFVDDAIKIEDYTNFEISIALYQKNKINSLVYDFLSGKSICCQHRIWCLGYWLPESFIENLKQMIKKVSMNYGKYIDMIVPGGLRWTEGIEFGMHDIRKIEMPKLVKNYNKKTLSVEIENEIVKLCKKYFPNKPVYFNSSCAISQMMKRSNIAMLNLFEPEICDRSICYNNCKHLCQNYYFNDDDLKRYEKILLNQGIKIKFKSIDFINKINSIPEFDTFNYSQKQQIRKTIALYYCKERINHESTEI